jgi:hypothetical protein
VSDPEKSSCDGRTVPIHALGAPVVGGRADNALPLSPSGANRGRLSEVARLSRGSGGCGGGRIASAEDQPGDFSQPEEGSSADAARSAWTTAREGVPLIVIQRQLGHTNLGITSNHLQASTTPRSSTER